MTTVTSAVDLTAPPARSAADASLPTRVGVFAYVGVGCDRRFRRGTDVPLAMQPRVDVVAGADGAGARRGKRGRGTFQYPPRRGPLVEAHEKVSLMRKGRWVPSASRPGAYPSYHFDALSSPFVPWDKIASRFISAGIPSGNFGVQAVGKFGNMQLTAIAAPQKGNVVRDPGLSLGRTTTPAAERGDADRPVETTRLLLTGAHPRLTIGESIILETPAVMRALAEFYDLPQRAWVGPRLF